MCPGRVDFPDTVGVAARLVGRRCLGSPGIRRDRGTADGGGGNVTEYTPSLPDGAWTDDDTDFEWVYILAMQARGVTRIPAKGESRHLV